LLPLRFSSRSAAKRTVDFAASNLRESAPALPRRARIVASYPFGPRAGAALNVTTLGYCDSLDIGVNVDPAAVTDIDEPCSTSRPFDDLLV
jgi:hypothetical protein